MVRSPLHPTVTATATRLTVMATAIRLTATATRPTATVMGLVSGTPRTVTLQPTAMATQLTAMVTGPATVLRFTGVTDTPSITPFSDAISMPPLMVFGVIGSKELTRASLIMLE